MALAAAARFGAVPRLVSAGRLTAVTFVHVRLPASGQELVQVDTGPTAVQLTSGVGRAALWPSDAAAAVVDSSSRVLVRQPAGAVPAPSDDRVDLKEAA